MHPCRTSGRRRVSDVGPPARHGARRDDRRDFAFRREHRLDNEKAAAMRRVRSRANLCRLCPKWMLLGRRPVRAPAWLRRRTGCRSRRLRLRPPELASTSSRSFALGVGGFGIVYLALDHSLLRQVALKEFMPARARRARPGRHRRAALAALRRAVRALARIVLQRGAPAGALQPSRAGRVHRFWKATAPPTWRCSTAPA